MLTDRELATVLAALRYWQRTRADCVVYEPDYGGASPAAREDAIATNEGEVQPLDANQIDELCLRINSDITRSAATPFIEMCRRVADSAANWADCSDFREAIAVFKELGDDCLRLLHSQSETTAQPRYVLYDFDADELAASRIYDSHAEAQEDADQFDNVVVVKLALPALRKNGTTASQSLAEPIPLLSILARLTGVDGWREVTGPESRCGLDYWYASPDGRTAYVNIDQDHITVSIDGESSLEGSLSDLNTEWKGE